MIARLLSYPLILVLAGVSALVMFLPAIHALVEEDHSVAQAFGYSGVLGLVLILAIGLAMAGRPQKTNSDLENLASLALAYVVLPVFLALPFYEGLETTSYLNAYFEMVSCLTTTGATLFDTPERLVDSLHLWRGLVGLVRRTADMDFGLGCAGAVASGRVRSDRISRTGAGRHTAGPV